MNSNSDYNLGILILRTYNWLNEKDGQIWTFDVGPWSKTKDFDNISIWREEERLLNLQSINEERDNYIQFNEGNITISENGDLRIAELIFNGEKIILRKNKQRKDIDGPALNYL